jgi:hypothetical protein
MSLSNSLRASILSYLWGSEDLKQLRSTATPLALNAGDTRDSEALPLANLLLADFADLDEGYISEQNFKQNLANLLFSRSASIEIELSFNPFNAHRLRTGTLTSVEKDSFALAGIGRALVPAL